MNFVKNTLLSLTIGLVSYNALADSIAINNLDESNIKVYLGDSLIKDTNESRFSIQANPRETSFRVLADDGDTLSLTLKSSYNSHANMCNYALLVSKNDGWKLEGYDEGCTPSEDHYNPPKPQANYTIKNNSNNSVYPAFALEGKDFASDSILGWLEPNALRIYNTDDAYWKSIGISYNDIISVAVYDPYKGYVVCSKDEAVNGTKVFTYDGTSCTEADGTNQ
ncbi:hypothetical protein HC723_16855 [Vibrio sp. S11_S32]|uniref:hypothetical protein n=1 Tax=Vibrio sp. S11_S32 TaxID=2720225 RepID=UPI001680D0AE|nr:hypothetical protein [Vibrio sp. S11_S32]MBD1578051.1 hypothetical protein [Vibrio sp. S11_S32]